MRVDEVSMEVCPVTGSTDVMKEFCSSEKNGGVAPNVIEEGPSCQKLVACIADCERELARGVRGEEVPTCEGLDDTVEGGKGMHCLCNV